MKPARATVSVIVPAYNVEQYVEKLLNSILAQDYSPIELFVINDGSTDSTLSILESYQRKFAERKIKYEIVSQKNKGQAAAINKGLKRFTGKYVTFIDADDYLSDDSIRKRVEFLEKHPDFSVVYGRSDEVDADNNYQKAGERRETHTPSRERLFIDVILERDYNWPPVQYLVRSKDFLRIYPDRHIAEFRQGQNIQIFLPLYFYGKVGYIDETLTYITVRNNSHSRAARSEAGEREYQSTARDIYHDTLQKIEMPRAVREEYITILQYKYDNRFAMQKMQREIGDLSAEIAEYRGIRRAAKLLVGNIGRRILGIIKKQ